jgi:hypothetical protein
LPSSPALTHASSHGITSMLSSTTASPEQSTSTTSHTSKCDYFLLLLLHVQFIHTCGKIGIAKITFGPFSEMNFS